MRDSCRVVAITSPANPKVKWLVNLRKRSERDSAGLTVVEGYAEARLALDAGVALSSICYCPDLVDDPARRAWVDDLTATGVETLVLGRAAFERASYRESPDGILVVVPTPGGALADLPLSDQPLVLVAESVEKPGNLGAMLRTADAAGVEAVIAASPATDWGNPNLVRASKGTVFAVPVAAAGSEDVADFLAEKGIAVVVATPDAPTDLTSVDLTQGVAVVVGAEHQGVSATWLSAPGVTTAAIPMYGKVNSLNVSVSAAIVLFEAVRQRSAARAAE